MGIFFRVHIALSYHSLRTTLQPTKYTIILTWNPRSHGNQGQSAIRMLLLHPLWKHQILYQKGSITNMRWVVLFKITANN